MELRKHQIEIIAQNKGFKVKTVIPSNFEEIEYLAVTITFGVTVFFLMNNNTFNYNYSHTYNFATDKTTKRIPSIFK
jgi:hypothetical protein